VTVANEEPFDDLDLFLATTLPGSCLLVAHESAVRAGIVRARPWGSSAAFDDGAFGYVVLRQLAPDKHEFGVLSHGPGAEALADLMVARITEWNSLHRGGSGPVISVHPAETPDASLPGGPAIDKKHTRVTVSWP
jgi:protein-L-isoaspartate(D-aspartate) O-methyltransferase